MHSIGQILKEQILYFHLIRRLSLFEIKSKNNSNYLGVSWEIINPLIQVGIYWFVFGYGIRGGQDVGGIPFFQWMLAGIIVWFFANPSILEGSKAIYKRKTIISKMNFPMSVIPSFVIFSKLYPHLGLLAIAIVTFQFSGYPITIYYLQIPYFLFSTVILLFSITLITSTLTTIIRDIQNLIAAFMRMLIYLTPILWVTRSLPDFVQMVMKANPLYYLVEGYRAAFFGQSWYLFEHWEYTLYFWALVFILLWIGSKLHLKFRSHFVELI
ncbi:ABC transporter permease [Fervidibacillus halotolerans]|uniref:Transport permease protein n=1 Tax=Fervidibacillus halotolerans TaxID=2980027 RepID=A0A9E8LYJ7_9BACI|nr:ABC transporter permease [Fervidibacillus halotolerans]WAA12128.1 ABC transporter permease [Fervidibacillus halotolerans]